MPMHLLRSMTRLRWCVLAWFALCYGVALATPLVKPHALALVCSSSGMALVSYAIRILPLTLIRKPIKNQFIQSFLYYVPYVTLAVMTFPAIVEATQSPVAGAVALRAAAALDAVHGAGRLAVQRQQAG